MSKPLCKTLEKAMCDIALPLYKCQCSQCRDVGEYLAPYARTLLAGIESRAEQEKHTHEWRDAWVAGQQETRCSDCGISIADHGALTLSDIGAGVKP